jgi:hypothetical protein
LKSQAGTRKRAGFFIERPSCIREGIDASGKPFNRVIVFDRAE